MKQPRLTRLSSWLLLAGLATSATAWAADGISYKFSGFGTLAGTVTDTSDLQFHSSLNQATGASSTLDLGTDSRLGLQGVVDFTQGLTVTGQLLMQRRRVDDSLTSNRDFDVGIEWLMAQYAVTPHLDLRLGRVVLPAFMISDSRNVGYSQPWLRAPLDVYAQMPLSTLDGIQAAWRLPVGAGILTLQPSFGKCSYNISTSGLVIKSNNDRVYGLNATFEYGDWLGRVGQVRGTTKDLGLDLLGIGVPIVYDMKDKFTSFGLQYDNGTAVVMAELATRRMNNLPAAPPASYSGIDLGGGFTADLAYLLSGVGGRPLARSQNWYIAGGWRFGKFLPMLAIGKTTNQNVTPHTSTRSLGLSLRYDLMSNVALKAQWNRYEAKDGSAFVDSAPSTDDRKVNVFAVGLDFVF